MESEKFNHHDDHDIEGSNAKPKARASSLANTLEQLSKPRRYIFNNISWVGLLVGFLALGLLLSAFTWFLMSTQNTASNAAAMGDQLLFTNLNEVRQRLHSKSDMPVYEFLTLHHQTGVLHGEQRNVVSEVFRALNHQSAEEGIPLLIDLFSDLYSIWPAKMPIETAEKLWALQDGEGIRQALLGLSLGDDRDTLEHANVDQLKRILTRVMDVDACIMHLKRIDRVRVLDFHGSPYGKKAKRHRVQPPPPTEENLIHATEALNELEKFVDGKDELNEILRSMLLDDLAEKDREEQANAAVNNKKHGKYATIAPSTAP